MWLIPCETLLVVLALHWYAVKFYFIKVSFCSLGIDLQKEGEGKHKASTNVSGVTGMATITTKNEKYRC